MPVTPLAVRYGCKTFKSDVTVDVVCRKIEGVSSGLNPLLYCWFVERHQWESLFTNASALQVF
jgi:hypothetical protein